VKADTDEVALDLSDQPAGNGFSFATVIWAPDSKRLAFNYGQGRTHATSLYQLRDEKWVALDSPAQITRLKSGRMNRCRSAKGTRLVRKEVVKTGQVPAVHLVDRQRGSMGRFQHRYCVRFSARVVARRDAPGEMDDGYGTDLLFTLRFDGAGKWKIVKTHRMSEKEVEEKEKGE
jgi:hypothetical protein